MKKSNILVIIFAIIFANCTIPVISKGNNLATNSTFFIENKGQWNAEVRYLYKTHNYNAWITTFGAVYDYFEYYNDSLTNDLCLQGDVIIMEPVTNTKRPSINYSTNLNSLLSAKYNYFIGNKPSNWATNVPLYKEIIAENVFNGINIRYYIDTTNNNNLRYDYELAAGAEPTDIKFQFKGAEFIEIDANESLVIHTKERIYKHTGLLAYQNINNVKLQIPCQFKFSNDTNFANPNNVLTLSLGEYDKSMPLTIDPLIYSVVMGGSDSEFAYAITIDTNDCAIVAGEVHSPDYPTVSGSYNINLNQGFNVIGGNSSDAFISKINKEGTNLIYSTFIGGTMGEQARFIKVDEDFNIYVMGETNSNDSTLQQRKFPVKSTNADLTIYRNGWNAFIAKLTPMGDSLIFSILIGGNINDYAGGLDFIKDTLGNVENIAVAVEINNNSINPYIPLTTSEAFQTNFAGGESDCYAAIINTSGSFIRNATYIGGTGKDTPKSLAVDKNKNVYIAGNTNSANFPTLSNAFQSQHSGGGDIFVAKLDSNLSNLLYSTYIGGSGQENLGGISLDNIGYAYIAGSTLSTDYPTTADAYSQTQKPDSSDIFVSKISQNGTDLVYSSTISSNNQNYATGIVVDENKNAHISGYTTATDFPATWDAFFNDYSQYGDAIYSVFDSTGANLVFSSFIGGDQYEYAYCLALDKLSAAYICGGTTSQLEFPHSSCLSDSEFVGYDSLDNPIYNKILGNYDVFVYKATYKPYPGELETNINTYGSVFCPNTIMLIYLYTPYGFYYTDNIFNIQISNPNGEFSPNSTIIGSLQSNQGGYLNITIPNNLPPSNKYRVRAVSTHPISVGFDNGIDLDIAPAYIKIDTNEIPLHICIGNQFSVPINANPCYNDNNSFKIELSDSDGYFTNPLVIATKIATKTDTLLATIPDTIIPSPNYKIRCVSTSPAIISNVVNISIDVPAISFENIDIDELQGLCAGDTAIFPFIATSCFDNDNIFYLLLSDSTGSFSNMIDTIGRANNDEELNMKIKIPDNLVFSEIYKIKLISTNPAIEQILGLNDIAKNYTLGRPFIFNTNLVRLTICSDFATNLTLKTNDCFEMDNIFIVYIKTDTGMLEIGKTQVNSKNVTITIPINNFIKDSTYIIVKSINPVVSTAEIPIKIKYHNIQIINHAPAELCAGKEFNLNYNTNGCIIDTLLVNIELSMNDTNFTNPTIIGNGNLFGTNGSITATLPDDIDENQTYYVRIVSNTGLKSSNYILNINPVKAQITTDMSDLTILCSGISFYVDFTADGCFDINNVFSIVLSDVNGEFPNENVNIIGSITSTNTGSIYVSIPLNIAENNKYRIKIISTEPETENILDIYFTIKFPFINIDSVGNILQCDPNSFTILGINETMEVTDDSAYVKFSTSDCFGIENMFILQFSKNGDFTYPINVDTCGWNEREFHFLLPDELGLDAYRLRVISTSPVVASNDNGVDIKYNQPYVALTASSKTIVCREKPTMLKYISNDCFADDNMFYLEMSDIYGDFTNPIVLDFNAKINAGEFYFNIPTSVPFGNTYKLRIRSTSPNLYFYQNQIEFTVSGPEILTGNLYRIDLQRNDTVFVPFNSNCMEMEGKFFVLQLSDPYGNFDKNRILEIGNRYGWAPDGKIYARISLLASDGKGYRMRVVCKEPDILGTDNGKNISIFGAKYLEVDEVINNNNPQIYPNPFNDALFIDLINFANEETLTINFIDMLGIIRKQISNADLKLINDGIAIETSDLISGVYIVEIKTTKKNYHRLIIKHSLD